MYSYAGFVQIHNHNVDVMKYYILTLFYLDSPKIYSSKALKNISLVTQQWSCNTNLHVLLVGDTRTYFTDKFKVEIYAARRP